MDEMPEMNITGDNKEQTANAPYVESVELEHIDEPSDVLESLPALEVLPAPTLIEQLTESIERYPDAPSNYVYRGEALLDEGHIEQAAQDFTVALQLAKAQALVANWGYIYQVLYERAHEGLRRAQA